MTQPAPSARQGEGRLLAIALALSLLVNAGVLTLVGFASLRSQILRSRVPLARPVATETTVTIFPEMVAAEPVPAEVISAQPRFARTSEDQTAAPPEKAPFIGERNTQATSDRRPDSTAPPLPSQAGIQPRNAGDFETTLSNYQDGRLESDRIARPQESMPAPPPAPVPDPALAENPESGKATANPGSEETEANPPAGEKLLAGPHPVDVGVPREVGKNDLKPTPPKRPKAGMPTPAADETPKPAVAKSSADPGFKGYQRKTAIVGSITRTGRSALDVADSPLGRYQAVISRAVELEWQRNCVRHRDFITPGFLTVRFFVESSGKVRTVQFVGAMETGEVQKGFTLNSIRNAEIPPMPAAVKNDFAGEPLELIFNFYF